MTGTIIDVAIGLFLLYLVLSIMASALNEFISNLLQKRARDLEKFIRRLFEDPQYAQNFYNTSTLWAQLEPVKTNLFTALWSRWRLPNKPTVRTSEPVDGSPALVENAPVAQVDAKRLPPYIKAEDFTRAIFEMVFPEHEKAIGENWKQWVSQLPETSPIRKLLYQMFSRADNDLNRVRTELEYWFNSSMERLTGWYKRFVQFALLLIGLTLALVFNIDTIAVTNSLLQNPALRGALVEQANAVLGQQPSKEQAQEVFGILQTQMVNIGLPIGWPDPTFSTDFAWYLKKTIGLLITAFAVSQGAPFWFDMLNRVTNLRGTEKRPPTNSTT